MHRVGLHLDGQHHRHGDLPLQLHTYHCATWPGGVPVCWAVRPFVSLLHFGLSLLQQAFCLVRCQLVNVLYPSPLLALSDALYLHLLSPAAVVADSGWSSLLSGLMIQSSASSDDKKASGKCECLCLMHADSCSALLADISGRCECVLCVTEMLGLLDCQWADGRMMVCVLPGVCVDYQCDQACVKSEC